MSIGTAKPTPNELRAVHHHLIGHISIYASYSVGKYVEEALQVISELHKKDQYVIVVGGTGLYLKGLVEGVDQFPPVPKSIVGELQNIYESEGITILQQDLDHLDPQYYSEVDIHNPQRLIRALSVIKASGKPFSSFRKNKPISRPWSSSLIALTLDRAELYKRINKRVDQMMLQGLLEEAQLLYRHRHLRSLDTVGYKELFHHLDGNWTLEEAVDKIKQHTRNYAKRQITWFSNQQDYIHVHPEDMDTLMTHI